MRRPLTSSPGLLLCAAIALAAMSAGVVSAVAETPALKDVAPKFLRIGAALNQAQSDGRDEPALAIVRREFNQASPENLLKWASVHPEPDRYEFAPADRYVDFGTSHGMFVVGHVLVWHQQTPAWVKAGVDGKPLDRETALARLKTHVDAVVGRYKGRIGGWDVVNEALEDDGSLRKTFWLEAIGEDYIAKAFELAHAADPGAELYYNDYNLWKPAKRDAAIRLVKELKAKGLRVDGIGEQGHWGIDDPPLEAIDACLGAIKASGTAPLITELDMDVLPRDPDMWGADLSKRAALKAKTNIYPDGLPAAAQEKLAKRYADVFTLFLKHGVARVTFWGVTDATSWLNNFPIPGRVNYPLLWDKDGREKPAKAAVVEVLHRRGGLPQLGQSPTADVVKALTREEKVGLVIGLGMQRPGAAPDRQGPAVGETKIAVPGAAGNTIGVPRLGIPSIVLADGPAGLRIQPKRAGTDKTYYCTAFPIETLLASSWDTALVERVGRAMGNETREYGVDVLLGPALNTHRNPLGGRNFEYYSEDPLVSGRMAAAMVKGVQAEGVGTSIKHFVANDHEWNRNVIDVKVSQRALREIYLRGFEIAVHEGSPWTVMSSYNKLAGTYTSESRPLLTGVLRDDWGFGGLVMTDWFGGKDAVAQMNAGNDLLMPGTAGQQKALLGALESGALGEKVLDRNVARVLELVQRTPAFRGTPHSDAPDLQGHAQVARDAAADGMVLLRNEGAALPLAKAPKVALLGNAAYAIISGGTGSGDVNKAYSVSLADGLKAAGLGLDAAVAEAYAAYLAEQEQQQKNKQQQQPAGPPPGFRRPPPIPEREITADEIGRLARDTDVALVTIGRRSGEGSDRKTEGDFELSEGEKALLKGAADAFHAQKKKLVVVLNVGGVVETSSWRELPDAILLAWQPGQEGGHAITDVLTGRTTPSGKLATTFPVRWEDVPSSAGFPGKVLEGPDPNATGPAAGRARAAEVVYDDDLRVGYRHYATKGVKVAYPFGYGLSYTRFGYSGLQLSSKTFAGQLVATVTVRNEGSVGGREVVQLYVSAPAKALPKPALELRAFAKTRLLAPGESETLRFTLAARDLASFDEASSSWVAEAGTYTVKVGASSEDVRQTATFTLAKPEAAGHVSTAVGTTPTR